VSGRIRALALLAVLVVAGLAPGGGGAVAAAGSADGELQADARPEVDSLEPHNNSTRHEDPDDASESGDLQATKGWLEGTMGERLERSSIQLSQGEYEEARSYVGDDYDDALGKYVDVAGETRVEGDDETAEQFQQAREKQQSLAEDVQEYQETRAEYEEARANGNETRARELARELERQAEAIQRNASELQRIFERISNRTAVDMTEAQRAIENVSENVSEQQAAVREATFVETRLSLSTDVETISFTEPLEATGRLVAANGSPVADRRVRVRVGEQTLTTRTDAAGRFTLRYRPTTMPVGEQAVTVRYVPANSSIYLGSNERISVTVAQVQPHLEVAIRDEELAFADPIVVNGSVGAEGVGAAAVPVVVFLGDTRLGETTTGANGSFTFEGQVPATVAAGERELTARVPFEDRALASSNGSANVQIASTPTRLGLTERTDTSDGLRVAGQLTTPDGTPVAGQAVVVALEETTLGTVRTGENGSFASTMKVPGRLRPESGAATLELVAAFDGQGTNLDASRATATVEVTAPNAPGGTGDEGPGGETADGVRVPLPGGDELRIPKSVLALVGVAVLVVLFGGVVFRRRWRREEELQEPSEPSPAATGSTVGSAPSGAESTPLDDAERHLEASAPDDAVAAAYAAIRQEVATALAVTGASTHWEFLQTAREAGLDGERSVALEALTERFERAAFAPGAVSVDEAEQVVNAARTLVQSVSTSGE